PASTSTADGRPATREAALRRLARSICSDRETFEERDAMAAAAAIAAEQAALVRPALMRVVERLPMSPQCFVVSGEGEFLARQIVAEVAPGAEIISLARRLGPRLSQVAPAHALAVLAAESPAG
ncbi:MAG TPA: hypothetical protein VG433_09170, partial [Pirellulales bacterium]|nr:hypothetical protein [Pirellulales bacterium]